MNAISFQSDAPDTKEHLSLLEFPFSNHSRQEGVITEDMGDENASASHKPSETPLQPAIKSEGIEGWMNASDLIESVWERIEQPWKVWGEDRVITKGVDAQEEEQRPLLTQQ